MEMHILLHLDALCMEMHISQAGARKKPHVTTIFYHSAAAAPSIESFHPTHSWQLCGHNITQLAPEPGRCCW
jgi:hypothetical protein